MFTSSVSVNHYDFVFVVTMDWNLTSMIMTRTYVTMMSYLSYIGMRPTKFMAFGKPYNKLD